MPVQENWKDEPCSILQITISGYWTWDEIIGSAERIRTMCADKTHRMDILVDLLKLTYRPPRTSENLLHRLKELPALMGVELVVFVVNDFMYSLIHPGISDLVPIPHKFVPGLNEGSELIERARSGNALPDYFSNRSSLN